MSSNSREFPVPWLGSITNLFSKISRSSPTADSLIFRMHRFGNCAILMLGLLVIVHDNYMSQDSITCQGERSTYATQYCWLHGYSYIDLHILCKFFNYNDKLGS